MRLQILPHRGEKRRTRQADSSWQMGARMEVSMGKSLEAAGDREGKNIPQYQWSGKKRISRLWWKKKELKDPEERKSRRKDLQAAGRGYPNFAVTLDLLASFDNKSSCPLETQPPTRH